MSDVVDLQEADKVNVNYENSPLSELFRRPFALVAIIVLVMIIVSSLLAPFLAPYDPYAMEFSRILTYPTRQNWLGTDGMGRDVLSRLLFGGRRSLLSVVEGVSVALTLGIPLGLVAGYFGGWTDRAISRFVEMLMSIPAIILVLVVFSALPRNEDIAMVTFGVLSFTTPLRVVRAATIQVRGELYITAARVSGLSHLRIMLRHVFPRIRGPIIVQGTLFCAYALLFGIGIAFLGLTGGTEDPSWGGMIGEGTKVIIQQSWLIYPPGILSVLVILCFSIIGNTIRDVVVKDETVAQQSYSRSVKKNFLASSPKVVTNDEYLLSVTGLEVKYLTNKSDVTIVDGVTFAIRAGETVGLVGESGCGKSVSALAMLRLLPNGLEMTGGSVVFDGQDITGVSDNDFYRLRGSTFAYISQEPQASLDPTFTIGSLLCEVIRSHEKISKSDAKRRAVELLALVELPDPERVAQLRAYELSGGMAQRVGIALALAGRPKLLIADEPTTALDVTVQAEILALLRRLQIETGMAILLITHNWGVVSELCDRTLVMYAGQIVEHASAQSLFDQSLHPYTQGLLGSLPKQSNEHGRLSAISGSVPQPGSWPAGCRFAQRCQYATIACKEDQISLITVSANHESRCIRIHEIFSSEAR